MWKVVMLVVSLLTNQTEEFTSRDAYDTKEACEASIPDRMLHAQAHIGPAADIAMWCRLSGKDI